MEYQLATERKEIGSFVGMWMALESAIHSKVSQKEQNKYCILTQLRGIQKTGPDEPISKAGIEMQTQRNRHVDPEGEGEGGMNWESSIDICTLPCIKQIISGNLLYNTGFPGGSDSKESVCNAGDLGLIPGLG